MSKLHQLRDQILESLRCQFAAKVHSIHLVGKGVYIADEPEVGALLLDLANNAAMGLDIEDDEHCPNCGVGPLHPLESDVLGRCAKCAAEAGAA